jgi:spore germination cell wall hydrolase CwlJ-like protein/DNA-binding CsgD family transcriptional regulator
MRFYEFITEAGGNPPFSPTPEQQQEIADLYASGFTIADIAKEYKITRKTMGLFLHRLPNFDQLRQLRNVARQEQGLSIGPKGITPDQVQQMANNFALGKNFNQLSKEFGITADIVMEKLKKLPNFEELLQQNTKARQEQGLLTLADLGPKGTTPAQIDQMAKEYASGKSSRQVAKMFNLAQTSVSRHLTKRPDWEEIKFQNRTNRSRKLGGTQSLTNRGINKPGSKGIHAIRRTGSPSGSVFEDALEEDWKKTLGTFGAAGALALGANKPMDLRPPRVDKPTVTAPAAPAAPFENPDVRILAQTIWGEARSHGKIGMLAVGNVIKNRAEDIENSRLFGSGIRGVALKPKQFSCWNKNDPNRKRFAKLMWYDELIRLRKSPDGTPFDQWFAKFKDTGYYKDYEAWLLAQDIAEGILAGTAPDPTKGAVYYHTTDVKPVWRTKLDRVASIGNHIFYTIPNNLSEYKVDNVDGLGSVPLNQNVDYMGLRVMMKPSTFLELALPLEVPRSVDYIVDYLQQGGALGAPFLDIKIPAEWEQGNFERLARVTGHEGRNRMLAVQKLEGDDPVEVHLLFRDGVRRRHLTPDMIKELRNGMMDQSYKKYVAGPLFSAEEA